MSQVMNQPFQEESEFDEELVRIYRCAKVVKGGRNFSFAALVVMGDRNGRVGIGYGKAKEVPLAVDKAKIICQKNMKKIELLENRTLPHRIMGRFGASKVLLLPASAGTGVIAGQSVRSVLELAGVKDCLTKSYGSNSPKNLVRATFDALCSLYSRDKIAQLRGVTID